MRDKLNQKELEVFIDTHDVIYVRHVMDSTAPVYEGLISQGIAAVHYYRDLRKDVDRRNLKVHEDPNSYEKDSQGRRVIERLLKYCESGAIVFADYSDPPDDDSVKKIPVTVNIGILAEKSHLKAVRYEPPNRRDYPFGLFYKQVELLNYRTLAYADFAAFLAIHPRGNTAIHWDEGEKTVKFIYKKILGLPIDPKSISMDLLFPAQLEVLCSEYLRLKAPSRLKVTYLLLPVGRGMKAIDIYGARRDGRLIAQVSYSKNRNAVGEKLAALEGLGSANEYVKVYFGPKEVENIVHEIAADVEFISLEEVFEAMKDIGIVDDMLR